jgi:hypothetical protein
MKTQKLYVLVRRDLKKSHQAVQGGHALAELLLSYKLKWLNGTLIYLAVEDEKALRKLYRKLPCRKKAFFEEPYWDNSMTAVAAFGKGLPKFLKKFPLL